MLTNLKGFEVQLINLFVVILSIADDERAIYSMKNSKQPPCTIPYVVSDVYVPACA